ncbi:17.4 kDa class III heat shock protein-like [Nymphaea colorata]|nr:17.4 kDa class III heat shock protein-like [Nymphaea colorata]
MSSMLDKDNLADGDPVSMVKHFLHSPAGLRNFIHYTSQTHSHEYEEKNVVSVIPVDILRTSKEYVFYVDVPGFSKADIQVTVEDEKILVLRGGGKRKREEGDEEDCRYIRMERRASSRFVRKFNLPDDSDVSSISARCENGVLTVTVARIPPSSEQKTVEIPIA